MGAEHLDHSIYALAEAIKQVARAIVVHGYAMTLNERLHVIETGRDPKLEPRKKNE